MWTTTPITRAERHASCQFIHNKRDSYSGGFQKIHDPEVLRYSCQRHSCIIMMENRMLLLRSTFLLNLLEHIMEKGLCLDHTNIIIAQKRYTASSGYVCNIHILLPFLSRRLCIQFDAYVQLLQHKSPNRTHCFCKSMLQGKRRTSWIGNYFYLTFNEASQLRTNYYIYNEGLPWPNPNDAGPIVRHPMGLPITAGCDTAWNRTRVCNDASSTEMQCLRSLRHSGVPKRNNTVGMIEALAVCINL